MRIFIPALFAGILLTGCGEQQAPRPSNAELGLNAQQVRGRQIYDAHCLVCHEAYTRGGTRGPSLMGLYKKPYMPSGAPANDERVAEATLMGRAKMPAYRHLLTQQQLEDLLAYMRTL